MCTTILKLLPSSIAALKQQQCSSGSKCLFYFLQTVHGVVVRRPTDGRTGGIAMGTNGAAATRIVVDIDAGHSSREVAFAPSYYTSILIHYSSSSSTYVHTYYTSIAVVYTKTRLSTHKSVWQRAAARHIRLVLYTGQRLILPSCKMYEVLYICSIVQ